MGTETKRWGSYHQYPMDAVRDFGEGPMLAIAIDDAKESARVRGVILAPQPDLIAWQYATYESYLDEDGVERMWQKTSDYDHAQVALLTLHFDVVDPTVVVDVVASL